MSTEPMDELQAFTAMLRRAGVAFDQERREEPFEYGDYLQPDVPAGAEIIRIRENSGSRSVQAYIGFLTEFVFVDGNLFVVGIWE